MIHDYNAEAKRSLQELGIDLSREKFTLHDVARGMKAEYEHGEEGSRFNVTNGDRLTTAKVALAHLYEEHIDYTGKKAQQYDYYDALDIIEGAPEGHWRNVKPAQFWLRERMINVILILLVVLMIYDLYCYIVRSETSSLIRSMIYGFIVICLY